MEKRIKAYLLYVDSLLDDLVSGRREYDDSIASEHLVQISFFQHERLIHLIVTALFAVLTFLVLMLMLLAFNIDLTALMALLLVLLVPYVRHYFILENGVQKMYGQYDRMMELAHSPKN